MITIKTAIDEVRKLINVASVKALVTSIYAGEVSQTEYNRAGTAKEKFITIGSLPVSFAQVQQGVINVNLYAPNLSSDVADLTTLDNILLAVKPLIEDASTSKIITELQTVSLLSEPTIKYSFYNLRVRVISVNETLNY
ncbi:MAG: hypothetical protein IPH58_04820 [Sphingobacteriales bacterium]|nr:hypothetical protein [Sphingobacteriales bacterium]